MQLIVPTMEIVSLEVERHAQRGTVKLRPRGILSTILGWFGLSKTQTYEADLDGYRVTTSSSSTLTRTYIPWSHAAGASFVSSKPLELLLTGFGLVSGSASLLLQQSWLYGGGMLGLGVLLILVFLMSRKKTSVGILADSGASETFKVHTTTEEYQQLEEYYDLLRDLIGASESASPSVRVESKSPVRPPPTDLDGDSVETDEGPPQSTTCPNCRTEMKIKPEFLGRRATCPSCQKPFLVV